MAWKDLVVGDIVRIPGTGANLRACEAPADCVFLSAPEEAETKTKCYVMTAQLDGETNFKLKKALPATANLFLSEKDCARFNGFVECEPPRKDFSSFHGTLHLSMKGDQGTSKVALGADQALWRGCVIRNVRHVYALIVYTGPETKVRVGQRETGVKKSSVERTININISLLAGMLLTLCIIGAVGKYIVVSILNSF